MTLLHYSNGPSGLTYLAVIFVGALIIGIIGWFTDKPKGGSR